MTSARSRALPASPLRTAAVLAAGLCSTSLVVFAGAALTGGGWRALGVALTSALAVVAVVLVATAVRGVVAEGRLEEEGDTPADGFGAWAVAAGAGGAAGVLGGGALGLHRVLGPDAGLLVAPMLMTMGVVAVGLCAWLLALAALPRADGWDPLRRDDPAHATAGWWLLVLVGGFTAFTVATFAWHAQPPGDRFDAGRALSRLTSEARERPRSARAQRELGAALVLLGDHDGARQTLARAVRLDPDDGRAWSALGFAFGQLGRWEDASRALERASRLAPEDERVLPALGWTLLKLGRAGEAVGAYRRAVAASPRSARAAAGLAMALSAAGRAGEGVREAERAVRLDPGWSVPHLALGQLLLADGRPSEARSAFREATRRREPPFWAWYELGLLSYLDRDYDEAASALARARELDSARFVASPAGEVTLAAARARRPPEETERLLAERRQR